MSKISAIAVYYKEIFQQIITHRVINCNANKMAYESEEALTLLDQKNHLQKPEVTVLDLLRNKLPKMRMLDIGIGTGRTTVHFASLAKEYIGVDYSNYMIKVCRKRLQNFPSNVTFKVADARAMTFFEDGYFDFVLFSFNGIDYVEHNERLKILQEIHRITKKHGYFCFSTHNLNYQSYCSIRLSRNPLILKRRITRLLRMRLLNTRAWKSIRNPSKSPQHTMVNDGALNFTMITYYITPAAQLKQLESLGFSNTKVYGLNGVEVKTIAKNNDQWLYYLTKVI